MYTASLISIDHETVNMDNHGFLTEQERRDEMDQAFKIVMSDGYILAPVLEEVIDELHGKDTEYILSCLDLGKDKRTVLTKGTESPSVTKGPVVRDTVFDVHLPDSRKVKVIVAVEGESKYDSGLFACARYIYYAARLISDQKGVEFTGDNYRDLKKVIVVWVNLNPPMRDYNTMTRYRMKGECSRDFEIGKGVRYCDYLELVEICIGKSSEGRSDMMGILNTVFDSSLSYESRKETMMERYKIPLTDRILRGIEKMANLTEEYLQSLYDQYYDEWHEKAMKQGIQEGLQQGREQGLQQGREQGLQEGLQQGRRQGIIEGYANVALVMVTEKGYSVDDALVAIRVDEGLEPEVRRQVETKLSQTLQ